MRPENCTSMSDIRTEIDRIDRELIHKFAERMGYIHRAAEIKKAQALPAMIEWRVEQVAKNAATLASEAGLDPAFYETIWRALIDHAIKAETQILSDH